MTENILTGSHREPLAGARAVGKSDPTERLEVTVLVRRQNADAFKAKVAGLASGARPSGRMTHAQLADEFGASPSDMATVVNFAKQHDLAVVQQDPSRRAVVLSGTVAQFNKAFGVELQQFDYAGGSYRGRTGPIMLPKELDGIVDAVLGLDNRPAARPHFRRQHQDSHLKANAAPAGSFTPTALASLYDFPAGDGKGQWIAIIELGGGYRAADLKTYFKEIKTSSPHVTAVSVDHGKNHATGDPNGPDGEVMLDIEVAGAIAPAANIVVYFAPNTDAGFLDAISTAIHDTKNKPSVISISWGGPESSWTQQAMTAFDQAFQAAALAGITVCVASGDNGSSDGGTGLNVDFPASSPHVLACGGTSLRAANGSIQSETVWNNGAGGGATGGGVSAFFPTPVWQNGLQVTNGHGQKTTLKNRGVPDVCGDADPQTGYVVRVDGSDTVIGGTSAVAPLWAGLIARINGMKGSPVGFINPQLYQSTSCLHDIVQGNNGDYSAAKGWDACTGLGSPDGKKIAGVLNGASAGASVGASV
jgi:kumamolisin